LNKTNTVDSLKAMCILKDCTEGRLAKCWLWQGKIYRGYGYVIHKRESMKVSRLMYRLAYGEFDSTLEMRHKCDTPQCCNPDHLIPGTHSDNMKDMVERGRANRSNGNEHSKVDYSDLQIITAINCINELRYTIRDIERISGLGYLTICRILTKQHWSTPRLGSMIKVYVNSITEFTLMVGLYNRFKEFVENVLIADYKLESID